MDVRPRSPSNTENELFKWTSPIREKVGNRTPSQAVQACVHSLLEGRGLGVTRPTPLPGAGVAPRRARSPRRVDVLRTLRGLRGATAGITSARAVGRT